MITSSWLITRMSYHGNTARQAGKQVGRHTAGRQADRQWVYRRVGKTGSRQAVGKTGSRYTCV